MDIRKLIIRYIDVYEGSEKRIIENVISNHSYEFNSSSKAKIAVEANIDWLVDNKYICVVNYNEMTDMQKRFYESDGYCRIFKIIKRYNESEYLKEKYSSQ
jgi:hypothetical protein